MGVKVTVVTPSYNQGRFIERTIESVLSQDVEGLEYLVFDGGSTDQTVEILKRYGSRLRWVSEKDGGQADAVNKGLRAAAGEVIGWLNSDDIYYEGAIRAACDYFAANPDIDIVYGDANHIDENDAMKEPYPTEAWNFERLLETCYICQPAVFFQRSAIRKYGVLDDSLQFALDYGYWLHLAKSGAKFGWLRKTLAGSRLYAETKTLGSRVKVHREINTMMRSIIGKVPDRWLFNYAHAVLDDKGVPRNSARFLMQVSLQSLYGSIRWNHGISSAMWGTTRQWLSIGARMAWQGFSAK